MRALPRVSVCIPVYNGGQFLAETIHSVLDQTYRDFELVVLDNASTDATGRIAQSFDDARVRVEANPSTIRPARQLAGSGPPVSRPPGQTAVRGRPPAPALPGVPGGSDGGRPRARPRRRTTAHDRRARPGAGGPPRAGRPDWRSVQRGGRPARSTQRRQSDRGTRRGVVPPGALLRRRRVASATAPRDGPRPVDAAAAVWRVPRLAGDSRRVPHRPAELVRRERGGSLRAPEDDHGRARGVPAS